MSGHEGYTESGYYEQALADLRKCKAERNRAHAVLSKIYKTVMAHRDVDANLDFIDQGSDHRNFERGQYSGFVGLANDLALILLEKDNETN